MTATVLISSMLLRAQKDSEMPHVENDRIVESKKTNISLKALGESEPGTPKPQESK
jgi:hypothetical protein